MTLKETRIKSNFKYKLYNIARLYSNLGNPNQTMERCINEKLNNSLETYQHQVERTCNYLLSRSSIKVLKTLGRMDRRKLDGK